VKVTQGVKLNFLFKILNSRGEKIKDVSITSRCSKERRKNRSVEKKKKNSVDVENFSSPNTIKHLHVFCTKLKWEKSYTRNTIM
jgi:hypothetical protein